MSEDFTFNFEGREISARHGLSLAAALTEAGIRELRETASGGRRGIFCGMGVCQECLVEVDGQPSRRACLTKAEPGMSVRSQAALPNLGVQRSAANLKASRLETPDVLVIGGGAAGLNAAVEAAKHGADTLVLDERTVGGGQYFKQTGLTGNETPLDAQQRHGKALIENARRAGVRMMSGAEAWGAFSGPVIHAQSAEAAITVRPRALIVATGAYERPRMVPGWTLPGVMTTGAAQTLWRSYRVLAGKRVAIVGNGPLNFQVALELLSGGAEVPLLAEAARSPLHHWRSALSMARADFRMAVSGFSMLARLMARRASPVFGTVLERIERSQDGLVVVLRSDTGKLTNAEVDAVCMNYGFHPQNEILRLLGAKMRYASDRAELQPERSQHCETSVPGLFAIGDCCGMGGAPAAMVEGRIAGRAAAAFAQGRELATIDAGLLKEREGHRKSQTALWSLFAARRQSVSEIGTETLICRCEEVTAGETACESQQGGIEIGSLKRATRLGMGPCQGRYCAQVIAPQLAANNGREIDEMAFFAPRVPIKPVPVSAVMAAQEGRSEG